ncbi:MAG: NAD(P)/FAD-dependent oxidoreductase [Gemmobacter sp.]
MNLLHANDRAGAYPPSWYAATAEPLAPFAPLEGEVRADVCVIGAGYTGLSAALHLAERGLDVVVLEAQRVGFGASGRNGGQVGSGQRLDQEELEARLGPGPARALWDIAEEAKALTRDLARRHAGGADYRPGVAFACERPAQVAASHAHARHLSRVYGYDAIAPLDRDAMARLTGSARHAGGFLDRGAGHLHPLRYALGLARAAAAAGVRIHEGAEVRRLTEGAEVVVETDRGRVRAGHAILACNGYLGDLAPRVARHVMPINNFIVATEPLGAAAPMAEPVAVADSRFVVNYWRQSDDGRLIFGGGESYGWRFPDIARTVRPALARIYPALADVPFSHAWGGTLAITPSRLPAFLRVGRNVLSASGYSGHGVALATMAGRILAEAVAGQAGRFDLMAGLPVGRFPGGAALRHPILVLAMTWYGLRDRLGL